jgi:SAM-dependent methyltransferase
MTTSSFDTDWLTQRRFQPVLADFGADFSGVLVDVGCGRSPYRAFFQSASAYKRFDVVAADDEVTTAPGHSLPLPDQTADLLLATQILGDLPNPNRDFAEWARVLKPSGLLIIFETVAYPEHDLPHDYWRIMPRGVEILAASAGFELVSMKRIGGIFSRIVLLINRQVIERLRAVRIISPLVTLITFVLNIAAAGLDRLAPMPSAATDYVAVFKNKGASIAK